MGVRLALIRLSMLSMNPQYPLQMAILYPLAPII